MFDIGTDNAISITRGDSAGITFTFTGDTPSESDSVILAVKKNVNSKTEIFRKALTRNDDASYSVSFDPDDTEDLPFGSFYRWDLRILYADGSVVTPISASPFVVMEVVTNREG